MNTVQVVARKDYSAIELNKIYESEAQVFKDALIKMGMKANKKLNLTEENIPKSIEYVHSHIRIFANGKGYWKDGIVLSFLQMKQYFDRMPDPVKKWFTKKNFAEFKQVLKLNEDDVNEDEINLFPGYKHKYQEFSSFSQETQDAVQFFIDEYVKQVLSSDREDSLKYILDWVAYMIQGNRNSSVLVMKGSEGIGKSTLIDFIKFHVLGSKVCVNGDVRWLETCFNYPLMGKAFVSFEEIRAGTKHTADKIASKFRDYITNPMVTYKQEGLPPLEEMPNLNNFITTSNNFLAIKGDEGRRYFLMDISEKFRDNVAYFTNLRKRCFNDEVGHAFFCLMKERDLSSYKWNVFPQTQRKLDAMLKSMCPAMQMIRDEYLLKRDKSGTLMKTGMNIINTELKSVFDSYCNEKGYSQTRNRSVFYDSLKNKGLVSRKTSGHMKYVFNHRELEIIALKNKWTIQSELVETLEDDDDDFSVVSDVSDYNQLLDKNKEYEESIKLLKLELAKMKKQNQAFRRKIKEVNKITEVEHKHNKSIIDVEKEKAKCTVTNPSISMFR